MNRRQLASKIDHTLLSATASPGEIVALVDEAVEHGFASVCVNSVYAAGVRELLDQKRNKSPHDVKLCVTAAFPLGAMTPMQRAVDATQSVKAGAEEIDLVPWLPRLIHQDQPKIRADVLETVRAVRAARPSCIVKMILETAALREAARDEAEYEAMIACACAAARESGCDFVKTSTGFHPAGGATVGDVRLLKQHAGGLLVKASGGIRDYQSALAMLNAGADRLGASASMAILAGASDEARKPVGGRRSS